MGLFLGFAVKACCCANYSTTDNVRIRFHELGHLLDRLAAALALMLLDLIGDFGSRCFFVADRQVIISHHNHVTGSACGFWVIFPPGLSLPLLQALGQLA